MKGWKLRIVCTLVGGAIASLTCAAAFPAGAEVTVAQLKGLYGSELEVVGEVQRVDVAHESFVVAGQHVTIAKETVFSYNGVPVPGASSALRMIHPGDMLAVTGPVDAAAISVSRLQEPYIAGATPIFVKGKVLAVDLSVGTAKIDEMGVDLTPAMSDTNVASIAVGQTVEVLGIQPAAGSRLLARSIVGTPNASPAGIVGTGRNGIVGTSGIVGTGRNGIVGTSGIVGTAGIVGTSE